MEKQFNPRDPSVQENKAKIRAILADKNVVVYFLASSYLCQIIAKGEHPLIQGMVPWIRDTLLQGKGIIVQKRIIMDLINDKLDEKNKFLFSNGDFRVAWQRRNGIVNNNGISWSDKSLRKDILKQKE